MKGLGVEKVKINYLAEGRGHKYRVEVFREWELTQNERGSKRFVGLRRMNFGDAFCCEREVSYWFEDRGLTQTNVDPT